MFSNPIVKINGTLRFKFICCRAAPSSVSLTVFLCYQLSSESFRRRKVIFTEKLHLLWTQRSTFVRVSHGLRFPHKVGGSGLNTWKLWWRRKKMTKGKQNSRKSIFKLAERMMNCIWENYETRGSTFKWISRVERASQAAFNFSTPSIDFWDSVVQEKDPAMIPIAPIQW